MAKKITNVRPMIKTPIGITDMIYPDDIFFYSRVKGRLMIRVGGMEDQLELLKEVPYTQVEDIAITYHVYVTRGITATVNNRLLDAYNIPFDQLREDATNNSVKLLPPSITTIQDALSDRRYGILVNKNILFETQLKSLSQSEIPAYVLTNKSGLYGASVMFYPGILEQIGAHFGSDYYVLPSSVHEVIIIFKEHLDLSAGLAMVREINSTIVEPKDKLTDNIYQYDRHANKLHAVI